MKKSLKIWLWVVLVVEAIIVVMGLVSLTVDVGNSLLALSELAVTITGICLLLFAGRKLGLYLVCVSAAVTMILNVAVYHTEIFSSIANGVLLPLITYFLMRSEWERFR